MKHIIFFVLNLALALLLYFQAYDPQLEYLSAISTTHCLKEKQSAGSFCAQCVWRGMQK